MDETQKQIHELFDRLHDIANSGDVYVAPGSEDKYITPKIANLLVENNRRLYERIENLESWIDAEVRMVKQRADRLMPPF